MAHGAKRRGSGSADEQQPLQSGGQLARSSTRQSLDGASGAKKSGSGPRSSVQGARGRPPQGAGGGALTPRNAGTADGAAAKMPQRTSLKAPQAASAAPQEKSEAPPSPNLKHRQAAYRLRPGHTTRDVKYKLISLKCLRKYWYAFCSRMAASSVLSTITTVLTIYALFGDDIRLMVTERPVDFIFDIVTGVSIVMFSFECLVRSFGQSGYLFGFFFWLDILSTMTLLLDVTFISEMAFGDEISKMMADDEQSGGGGASSAGSSSAEAARAARMSRVGTKASRVVRLIRLIRLIKFVRCFNRDLEPAKSTKAPGQEWDYDEDSEMDKESAVSKKLSEMTTRRVVILVLVIMLGIPCFQDQTIFFTGKLPFSAQYGINNLYRRWREGLEQYKPVESPEAHSAYMASEERRLYIDDYYMYVYFHNPFCVETAVPEAASASPLNVFGNMFWMGMGPVDSPLGEYFLPRFQTGFVYDLNERWNGEDWKFYQCDLTSDPASILDKPWQEAQVCLNGAVKGISLLQGVESQLDCPEKLRYQERAAYFVTSTTQAEQDEAYWFFIFDRRSGSRTEALLNMLQTLFICLLLGVGSMTFSNDANKLVLIPIERMISKIDRIRVNPLAAMHIGDQEHSKEAEQRMNRNGKRSHTQGSAASAGSEVSFGSMGSGANDISDLVSCASGATSTKKGRHLTFIDRLKPSNWRRNMKDLSGIPEPMETVVLEKTIIKIGSLLALGFGEAGAGIIGHSMKGGDSAALNAMIPGRRVDAIFGYCNIRSFSDATEVLQDQVMIFVNRIASVVHSCINEFFGSPNRNIGDAFLLVWDLEGWDEPWQRRLADMSLLSIYKVIAEISKSPLLAEYRSHLKLIKRLPNYRVRLSFGLHKGWAIEGAIGSEFKIDASYLSPNVNLATKLEACTKQYGTLILLSDTICELMTPEIAEECRRVDSIKFAGFPSHLAVFTLDLDDAALPLDRKLNPLYTKRSGPARLDRQKRRMERWSEEFQMYGIFEEEKDMKIMRRKYTNEFLCRFRMAYLNYEAGEWAVAKDMLEVTRFLLTTEDGPSAALLKFMKQFDYKAPERWPGYRVLSL